ncbi:MAG TPA: hybrid sensor histidine kinase/response regulator [Candidatus Saccharimonadales bacterium]|jgi:signal transduction histidine kinase|nr:hybrid sensor histidine kinase/response regulator [Candidatus Saccharimonadales bacterium]
MQLNTPENKTIKVLLVDDDEDDYLILSRVFTHIPDSPFRLEWCASFDKAKSLIDARGHDIYLIDYRLAGQTGLELLEYAQPYRRSEPFILLTGVGDREIEIRSMKLAAADYLVKGTINAELLARTLYYSLERKQFEEQRLHSLIELNRAKDEFISLAAHQLRTPATGVKQYLGMVLEGFVGDLTDKQKSILQKANESNERQLRIVTDLLKVAQVDAGKVRLRKADVDVVSLINDVIKEQRETFDSRNQTVIFEPKNKNMCLHFDRDTIRMVIENLIDNASKYSGMDKTVTVKLDEAHNEARITIIDKGVGIKPEDQDKLFEKFSRIENPLSMQVGGTGLGLYWAKKIIDLHQGRVTFESQVGEGTRFTIHLPKTRPVTIAEVTSR